MLLSLVEKYRIEDVLGSIPDHTKKRILGEVIDKELEHRFDHFIERAMEEGILSYENAMKMKNLSMDQFWEVLTSVDELQKDELEISGIIQALETPQDQQLAELVEDSPDYIERSFEGLEDLPDYNKEDSFFVRKFELLRLLMDNFILHLKKKVNKKLFNLLKISIFLLKKLEKWSKNIYF